MIPEFGPLNATEQVIRRYHAARLRNIIENANAYLTVTSERIVVHSMSGWDCLKSNFTQQMRLKDYCGLMTGYSVVFSWFGFLFWLVLWFGGWAVVGRYFLGLRLTWDSLISAILHSGTRGYLILAGLVVAGIFVGFIFGTEQIFALDILSTATSPGISLGGGYDKNKNGALRVLLGKPTAQTDKMIFELGTMLEDLQKRGSLAIKTWQEAHH
jgi:hypothetical protein